MIFTKTNAHIFPSSTNFICIPKRRNPKQ